MIIHYIYALSHYTSTSQYIHYNHCTYNTIYNYHITSQIYNILYRMKQRLIVTMEFSSVFYLEIAMLGSSHSLYLNIVSFIYNYNNISFVYNYIYLYYIYLLYIIFIYTTYLLIKLLLLTTLL